MTKTITCYDCHKNEPGRGKEQGTGDNGGFLGSTRMHFGEDFSDVDPATAACAQCHNEYYFTPGTRAVTLPGTLTDPKDIFDYYQKIEFVDYVNPSTGTEHLKVQHPEFQVYTGSVHDLAGYTCADCHLERDMNNKGVYTNHRPTNPTKSETIRRTVCSPCHGNLGDEGIIKLIKDTQKRTDKKTHAVGARMGAFSDRLTAAINAGTVKGSRLDELRALNREAQWYWDWVFVDNGNGVHNPPQAMECLEKADKLLAQAEKLLP